MVGRTHDLAAFTAMNFIIATQSVPNMTLATAFVAFSANMIGGLAPDLDQSTGALWRKVRLGSLAGKLLAPFFGGHRNISHSILGIFLLGFIAQVILTAISKVLIVDMDIVWFAFMLGLLSHLFMDLLTLDGIPLLFPLKLEFGFPPIRFFRIRTGGLFEKGLVFPGLILLNMYIFYLYHPVILSFLRTNIK